MTDNDPDRKPGRDTHQTNVTQKSGNSNSLLIGGIVIAIVIIVYVLFGMGGGDETVGTTGEDAAVTSEAPEATGGDTTGGDAATGGDTMGGDASTGGDDATTTDEPAATTTEEPAEPEANTSNN